MVVPAGIFAEFLARTAATSTEELVQIPLSRHVLAHTLADALGADAISEISGVLGDRARGAITLRVPDEFAAKAPCIRLLTALAHLLGTPNSEPYSQEFYGSHRMTHADHTQDNLWGPYQGFPLHTAGSPLAEPCDWFVEARLSERFAANGRRRLLHVDDWEEAARLSRHPLARRPVLFRMPVGSDAARSLLHPAVRGVQKPVFFGDPDRPFVRFIDCFVVPQSYDESVYLASVAASLRRTARAVSLPLPPVSLLTLNNHVWLHGRSAFAEHPEFELEMLLAHGAAYPGSALSV